MCKYKQQRNIAKLGIRNFCIYCGEPHLCGQLPKQHTSKPVYVVADNSYTVTLICIHNCVQKYTSVYLLLSTNLLLVCLGYFHNILLNSYFYTKDIYATLLYNVSKRMSHFVMRSNTFTLLGNKLYFWHEELVVLLN